MDEQNRNIQNNSQAPEMGFAPNAELQTTSAGMQINPAPSTAPEPITTTNNMNGENSFSTPIQNTSLGIDNTVSMEATQTVETTPTENTNPSIEPSLNNSTVNNPINGMGSGLAQNPIAVTEQPVENHQNFQPIILDRDTPKKSKTGLYIAMAIILVLVISSAATATFFLLQPKSIIARFYGKTVSCKTNIFGINSGYNEMLKVDKDGKTSFNNNKTWQNAEEAKAKIEEKDNVLTITVSDGAAKITLKGQDLKDLSNFPVKAEAGGSFSLDMQCKAE